MRVALVLVALLLAGTPASAAEFDFRAPGFWTRVYDFTPPPISARACVRLDPSRRKALQDWMEKAGGRLSAAVGSTTTVWCFGQARPSAVREGLASLGRIEDFTLDRSESSSPPVPPELLYKQDRLRSEAERLGGRDADLPAVTGLLDAQLGTIDRIIKRYESPGPLTLHLDIPDAAGRCPLGSPRVTGMPGTHYPGTASPASGRDSRGIWERTANDVACLHPPVLAKASVAVPANRRSAADAALERYRRGLPPVVSACLAPGRIAVPRTREEEFRRLLRSLGELKSWSREEASPQSDGLIGGAWKARLLGQELEKNAGVLADAPHVEALVLAEIERLRPASEELARLEDFTLVELKFE